MPGLKHDQDKLPVGLLPTMPLLDIAAVLRHGATKYGRHNWRAGMAWSRVFDATLRHLLAWNEGEDCDLESGLNHLAHAACDLLFLLEYTHSCPDLDDRHQQTPPTETEQDYVLGKDVTASAMNVLRRSAFMGFP